MKAYIKTGKLWGVLVMDDGERYLFTFTNSGEGVWGTDSKLLSLEGLDEIPPEELFPRLAAEVRAALEKQRLNQFS